MKPYQAFLSAFVAVAINPLLTASDFDFGSKSDLWDVSQGARVTSISGRANPTFRPENIFGASFPTSDGLPAFTFEDGKPAGFVHYVEWETISPVSVSRIHLHAQGDGPSAANGREFNRVRIYAKSPGSSTYNNLLLDYTPSSPYSFENFDVRLLVSTNFPPVTATQFRAEFVDTGVTLFSAPRVWELDAFGAALDFGSKSDVWDTTQGAVVTQVSGRAGPAFNPDNMFGATYPTPDGLPSFTFEDGRPQGYVHFIEWRTKFPVTVRSFNLHAQGDGTQFQNGREFDRFRLLAKSPGSSTFNTILYDFTPTHPYSFEDYETRLVISDNLPLVAASEFRAEFFDTGVRFWSAPRIWELDGFLEPKQTSNLRVFPAIELLWMTTRGVKYRIEWKEDLFGSNWRPYGDAFTGTGESMTILVSTRDQTNRYFRLVELPE